MKCSKCNSDWNSTVKSDKCPFCGENLEIYNQEIKTIEGLFSFVFSEYGITIINEHRRFLAVLSDYAPQMNNERALIKIALESGAYSSILNVNDKDPEEQEICFKRVQSMLVQKHFLNRDWAEKVLMWLTDCLNWNINIENFNETNVCNIDGINKKKVTESVKPSIDSYLKRGFMFLEEKDWIKANEYFEKILDINPEYADAYLGKLMVDLKLQKLSNLYSEKRNFSNNKNYQKIIYFGTAEMKNRLNDVLIKRHHGTVKLNERRKMLQNVQGLLAINRYRSVGLCSNGTVVTVGKKEPYDLSDWWNIVSVAVGYDCIFGLRSNGTVVTLGNYSSEQRRMVGRWKNIVAISASASHIVGLHADGSVVAAGQNDRGQCNVGSWSDIVAVDAGSNHTVGLRSNGTVVATGWNVTRQCNVERWKNIVDIAAGGSHTVGLCSDGTVLAVGELTWGQCDVGNWADIIAISAGFDHTVGLCYDGTLIAVGNNDERQCNIEKWSDIVAISANERNIIGVRADGTVIATGQNDNGQCMVNDWKLFDSFNNFKEEQNNKMKLVRKHREELQAHRREKNLCQHCGGTFKGFFKEKCSVCNKDKDY